MEEEVELRYDTWGSFGQYKKTTAVLVDGNLVDPETFLSNANGERSVVFHGIKLRVIQNNSRKNVHITVVLPKKDIVAVISEIKTSGGLTRDIQGQGELITQEEVQELTSNNKKYKICYCVCYYVNTNLNIKVELERTKKEVESELVGKPQITIVNYRAGKIIGAQGDTYYLRDELKRLGFKWDGLGKVWLKQYNSEDEINQVVKQLQELAEVKVV